MELGKPLDAAVPSRLDFGVAGVLVTAAAVAAVVWGRYGPGLVLLAVVLSGGLGALAWRRQRLLLVLAMVGVTVVAESSLTSNNAEAPLIVSLL